MHRNMLFMVMIATATIGRAKGTCTLIRLSIFDDSGFFRFFANFSTNETKFVFFLVLLVKKAWKQSFNKHLRLYIIQAFV